MKCIICHSTDISLRRVNEQLSRGEDMILVPMEVLVCTIVVSGTMTGAP